MEYGDVKLNLCNWSSTLSIDRETCMYIVCRDFVTVDIFVSYLILTY